MKLRFLPAIPRRKAAFLLFALLLPFGSTSWPGNGMAAEASTPYDDVKPNFASDAIARLTEQGIAQGTGKGRFEPLRPVSRAEFVSMLVRSFGLNATAGTYSAYKDVPRSAWYYGWVQAGVPLGIAQGVSSSAFEPLRSVSRQEAAVFLSRALKQEPRNAPVVLPYIDEAVVAEWAKASVGILSRIELMEGDDQGRFRPSASLTRQEAAVLIDRVLRRESWSSQFSASTADTIQLGWQYGQTTAQFQKQVASSSVNTLSPRWYFLSDSGTMSDSTDSSLVAWAHARGKKVWAMVGNRSDQAATSRMLGSAGPRQAFASQLAAAVKRNGLDGLNVDFENVAPEDRAVFTLFVEELAFKLKPLNATLSVNVSPDLATDWTEAFDYAALGRAADYIVLMGYDQHWGGSPVAGSVSSLPWLRSGIEKLLGSVPAGKTIVAVPFYTRDWYTDSTGQQSKLWSLPEQDLALQSANPVMRWNDALGQYEASYAKNGVQHRVWVEDGRSLARKTLKAADNGVAGYAFWYMGGETPDVWSSIGNAIKYGAFRFP